MPHAFDNSPRLQDSLILVVATAIGLAAVREIHGWYFEGWSRWSGDRGHLANVLLSSINLLAASWTVALLGIRLRRPRPSLRRLGRRPGYVATFAASIGLAVVSLFLFAVRPENRRPTPPIIEVNTIAVPCLGTAVAVAWLAMVLEGRWRPEPSWIDRAGRGLGFLWLFGLLAYLSSLAWDLVNRVRAW